MALRASDLSYSDKQQLLNQLKSQIGDANYDQLVRAHGEDGLLDMALQAAEKSLSQPPKPRESWWKGWGGLLVWCGICILGCFADPAHLGTYLLLLSLPFVLATLGWLWNRIAEWWRDNMSFPRF